MPVVTIYFWTRENNMIELYMKRAGLWSF